MTVTCQMVSAHFAWFGAVRLQNNFTAYLNLGISTFDQKIGFGLCSLPTHEFDSYPCLEPLTRATHQEKPNMADHVQEHELKPDATEGFKVGEKKTIDEYQQLGEPQFLSSRLAVSVLLLTLWKQNYGYDFL